MGEALTARGRVELFTVAYNDNPGLSRLSERLKALREVEVDNVVAWAREQAVELAVIGFEDPLGEGLADALQQANIPTVGPRQAAARLETSKLFTRDLMERHCIPGRVEYHYFTDGDRLTRFLRSTAKQYALKPDGLTAGKGVKVMGVQLASVEDAVEYGRSVIRDQIGGSTGVIIEERLIGEEFSLQAFVDGETLVPMPLVRDYKQAFEGDQGPNTGSMGSYSQADGLLPYVTTQDRDQALETLRRVVAGLSAEGITYQGVIYGQFMMTAEGSKLIEINARFGDPEAMNVLPLLESDFTEICIAITESRLRDLSISFTPKATVCKYITPPGYPLAPRVGTQLRVNQSGIEALGVKVYFAKIGESNGEYRTTTSRAIALVGIADSVENAEMMVEESLAHVEGDYHLRHDIGTQHLIQRSVSNMERLIAGLRV